MKKKIATGYIVCFRADHGAAISELKGKRLPFHERMEAIQALADAENRELTEAELTEFEANRKKFEAVNAQIKRREMLADNASVLDTPDQRISAGMPKPVATPGISAGRSVIPVGQNGYQDFGSFALSVMASCPGPQFRGMDDRIRAALPTNYGSETSPADGGYLVPPDFRAAISSFMFSQESLLSRTDQNTTPVDAMSFPKDETTPWSGGIQVYWTAAAGDITTSKQTFQQEQIRLHKLAALVPVTTELQRYAPALTQYLMSRVPLRMTYAMNDAMVNGLGANNPLGIMNSACKITVSKEAGQTAATINYANIFKMWNRRYAPLQNNLVWLINQDSEPQLQQLALPSSTVVPAWMPPGGLSASPYSTLLGKPVIPLEQCKALGTEGDIILCDWSQYMSLTSSSDSGVRQDMSIHMWFNYDINAFRFITYVGGQPWWSAAITPPNSANTRSPIVTLQTRS